MATKEHSRPVFLILGSIFFLVSVLHLIRFFRQPDDIWWTHTTMRVPLRESRDRVEIYAAGVLLQEHLKSGRLLLAGEQGTARLDEASIGLRFNNWDRVRSQQIPALLSYAAGAGAAAFTLLFSALGWIPRRAVDANASLGPRS